MSIGSCSIQIWWGLCGMTKFYRSCAAFEHRGKAQAVGVQCAESLGPSLHGCVFVPILMAPSLYKYLTLSGIMPRDLFSSDPKDESLVASPESQTPKPEGAEVASVTGHDGSHGFTIHRDEIHDAGIRRPLDNRAKANENDNLHPYVQTLSISNLESCVALENAIFPEHERCSREKVDLLLVHTIVESLANLPQMQRASISSCF